MQRSGRSEIKGIVEEVLYVAPTELDYRWIIRSTNSSSLRDYEPLNFGGVTHVCRDPGGVKQWASLRRIYMPLLRSLNRSAAFVLKTFRTSGTKDL